MEDGLLEFAGSAHMQLGKIRLFKIHSTVIEGNALDRSTLLEAGDVPVEKYTHYPHEVFLRKGKRPFKRRRQGKDDCYNLAQKRSAMPTESTVTR